MPRASDPRWSSLPGAYRAAHNGRGPRFCQRSWAHNSSTACAIPEPSSRSSRAGSDLLKGEVFRRVVLHPWHGSGRDGGRRAHPGGRGPAVLQKLIINIDGTIKHADLIEPFAQLLTPNWHKATRDTENLPDTPGHLPAPRTPSGTPRAPRGARGVPGSAPAGVAAGGTTKTPTMILSGLVRIRDLWWSS